VEKGDRGASGHSLRASRLRKMASARQRLRRGRCDARAMIQGSRQTTIHARPDSPPSFFALPGARTLAHCYQYPCQVTWNGPGIGI